jgi:hypothetical protein
MRNTILLLAVTAFSTPLAAQETIATDRPDFVESSLTVGRGVFQLETSGATDWVSIADLTHRSVTTPTLFRLGISAATELRLETAGYTRVTVDGSDAVDGLADISLGLKWHALDGEGNRPSVAFLIHGDLPSGSEPFRGEGVRPSLRAVGEWALPSDFSFGVMPGIGYARVAGNGEWTAQFGAVVGKPVSERLRFFVEYAAEEIPLTSEAGNVAYFQFGTAWTIGPDVQLDLSAGIGLTDAAADGAVAIGFSRRFR